MVKEMFKNKITLILLFIIACLLFIVFIQKQPKDNEDTKPKITKVVTVTDPRDGAIARWNALIEKKWEEAYGFQSPNYRKTYSLEAFKNSFGRAVEWKKVKLLSEKKISDTVIDVEIELISLFKDSGVEMMLPGQFEERWQKIDNSWWHLKKK